MNYKILYNTKIKILSQALFSTSIKDYIYSNKNISDNHNYYYSLLLLIYNDSI